MSFEKSEIHISARQNEPIPNQLIKIYATKGSPDFILSPDPYAANWLILPKNPKLGTVEIKIKDNLPVGKYSTTIFAIDQPDMGYVNGEIRISVNVLEN